MSLQSPVIALGINDNMVKKSFAINEIVTKMQFFASSGAVAKKLMKDKRLQNVKEIKK